MTREWRRLLVCPQRLAACAGRLELLAEESHYLRRVLRLRGGEQLALLDGRGRLWTARLELVAGGGRESQPPAFAVLEQPLAAPLLVQPPPRPALELAVAMPRLDADGALRMACELGIDRFTPLQAARSVLPPQRLKAQRLQAIVREAVEQCERLWLPQLAPEQAASRWFGSELAEPAGGAAAELRLLATTRRSQLVPLEDLLLAEPGRQQVAAPPGAALNVPQWIRLAIGPEGGWTGEEEEQAAAAGWLPVSLGDTILRTSTAAVLAAGWMAAWRRLLGRRGGGFSS